MMRRNFFGLLGVLAVGPVLAQMPQIAPTPPAQTPPVTLAPQAAQGAQIAQVSQQALLDMQARKDASLLLIDVRTPAEYAAGHIPGAVNIPHDQIAAHVGEIPKNDEVVLYCHSGRRAGLAAQALASSGYKKLAHLEGDMQGWQAAGRPVETSAATVPPK
jgi:phage shock protein E